jgi:hypothetical protein
MLKSRILTRFDIRFFQQSSRHMHFVEKAGYQLIWLNGCRIILEGKLMREKEIAQRIIALYQSQSSDEDKKQFVALLKSIITIIETMNRDDFEKFVDDFGKHLDELEGIKKEHGIRKS